MKCANCGKSFELYGHLRHYADGDKNYCSFVCFSTHKKTECPRHVDDPTPHQKTSLTNSIDTKTPTKTTKRKKKQPKIKSV